ncbi:MAG: hypothetical protein ACLPJH_20415 [Myxococcaceae bacterium]
MLLLILYCADWTVLRIRVARGSGLGSIQVRHFVSTPLKGNRDEFDLVDSVDQPCVQSAFPHQGLSACWWLQLHRDQWQSL